MEPTPVYKQLASLVTARKNCATKQNAEWYVKHTTAIEQIVKDHMPSGSGWDFATKIDFGNSTGEKLVMYGEYHHMIGGGYYDGWTAHTITVRASLAFGISISISGRNRMDIKEDIHQMFHAALNQLIAWDATQERYTAV